MTNNETYTCTGCGRTVRVLDQPQHILDDCRSEKFDRILVLETDARGCNAQLVFARNFFEKDRAMRQLSKARAKLYAAIEALTEGERVEFGQYRVSATR